MPDKKVWGCFPVSYVCNGGKKAVTKLVGENLPYEGITFEAKLSVHNANEEEPFFYAASYSPGNIRGYIYVPMELNQENNVVSYSEWQIGKVSEDDPFDSGLILKHDASLKIIDYEPQHSLGIWFYESFEAAKIDCLKNTPLITITLNLDAAAATRLLPQDADKLGLNDWEIIYDIMATGKSEIEDFAYDRVVDYAKDVLEEAEENNSPQE